MLPLLIMSSRRVTDTDDFFLQFLDFSDSCDSSGQLCWDSCVKSLSFPPVSACMLYYSYSRTCSHLVSGPRSCLTSQHSPFEMLEASFRACSELLLNSFQIESGLLSWDNFSQGMSQLQVFMADYSYVIMFHSNKSDAEPLLQVDSQMVLKF